MQTTQELPSQVAAGALRAQRQPGGWEGARKHTWGGTEVKGAPWKEGQAGMDPVGGLQASAEADEVNEGEITYVGEKRKLFFTTKCQETNDEIKTKTTIWQPLQFTTYSDENH